MSATHTHGPAYEPSLDAKRLSVQRDRIRNVLLANAIMNRWMTLGELKEALEDVYDCRFPEASISAQLRHLRKPQFGGYGMEKRRRGHGSLGLWEYRICAPVKLWKQLDFTRWA